MKIYQDQLTKRQTAALRGLFVIAIFLTSVGLATSFTNGHALAGNTTESLLGENLMELQKGLAGGQTLVATGWYLCDVKRVGPGWGNIYLSLTCPSVTEQWFIAEDSQKRDMLAAGLTAISINKKVNVYIQHASSGYDVLRTVYVQD